MTYHEAFVAQGSREILDSGQWMYPTIGGLPWLEKPPLPWWLAAALGRLAGGVDETVARLPSALAAMALVLGVAVLAARHFGPTIGLLAGAVQATTAWTVLRGRLAEADVLLACLITWSLVAFDEMLVGRDRRCEDPGVTRPRMASRPVDVLRIAGCHVPGQGHWLRCGDHSAGRGRDAAVAARSAHIPPAVLSGRLVAGNRAGLDLAALDDRTARRRCTCALDDARDRPPEWPERPRAVCQRALVGIRSDAAGAGAAVDSTGPGRLVSIAAAAHSARGRLTAARTLNAAMRVRASADCRVAATACSGCGRPSRSYCWHFRP